MTLMDNYHTVGFLRELEKVRWNFDLGNIANLLELLGNPHEKLKCIHVAGTNGKGSVTAMMESILRESGYKTGMFTSPHIVSIEERFRIDGCSISPDRFEKILLGIKPFIVACKCTYFESMTAIAFTLFAEETVDFAIIECGLGGRLDATNVIKPLISVITEIHLEHEKYLGKTFRAIAQEKAGIIKSGAPCIALSAKGNVQQVFQETCNQKKVQLHTVNADDLFSNINIGSNNNKFTLHIENNCSLNVVANLAGAKQVNNAALAIKSLLVLEETRLAQIKKEAYKSGLSSVSWPGRLQQIRSSPTVIVDVAHNPAAVQAVLSHVSSTYQFKRMHIIIGLLNDKNFREISKVISRYADHVAIVTLESDRALPGEVLASHLKLNFSHLTVRSYTDIKCSVDETIANSDRADVICIIGSHLLAGRILAAARKVASK